MKVTNNPSPNPYQTETQVEGAKGSLKTTKNSGLESALSNVSVASHLGSNVEISDGAQLMRQASDIAKATTDIRKEKVAELKKNIQNGTYHVEAREIADRLVDEHLSADFGKNNH